MTEHNMESADTEFFLRSDQTERQKPGWGRPCIKPRRAFFKRWPSGPLAARRRRGSAFPGLPKSSKNTQPIRAPGDHSENTRADLQWLKALDRRRLRNNSRGRVRSGCTVKEAAGGEEEKQKPSGGTLPGPGFVVTVRGRRPAHLATSRHSH